MIAVNLILNFLQVVHSETLDAIRRFVTYSFMGTRSSVLVKNIIRPLRFDYLWLSGCFHAITGGLLTDFIKQILTMSIFVIIISKILNWVRHTLQIVIILIVLDACSVVVLILGHAMNI